MRQIGLILLLSLAYVGCGGRGHIDPTPPASAPAPATPEEVAPPPPPEFEVSPAPEPRPTVEVPRPEPVEPPRYGGAVRVVAGEPSLAAAVARSSIAEPLVPGRLLASWRAPSRPGDCWRLELDPTWAYPDGSRVSASDIVAAWERALRRPGSAATWLLEVVRGADDVVAGRADHLEGARARDGSIELCTERPAPDLLLRLAHPELWHGADAAAGPGPFHRDASGTLVPNPAFARAKPYLDRVETAVLEGDPGLLFRLGDAHLTVAWGRGAATLAAAADAPVVARRLPAWDRTYFLWFEASRRWANDPALRRWLSGTVDRQDVVNYVFDGRGVPAWSLAPATASKPVYGILPDRPLSASSRPRLSLAWDEADPQAAILALRLHAVLELQSVVLTLEPMPRARLVEALATGSVDAALLAHRPAIPDPVLALLGTVWWLGPGAEAERAALVEAATVAAPDKRAERARAVERELLGDARLVPLVRLEAWLGRHDRLAGIAPGPDGVLRLEEAWWTR